MGASEGQLNDIIERARSLGPLERFEFVRQACGPDETLLSQVLSALTSDQSSSGFWDEVADGESQRPMNAGALEGQRLGQYRIVSKIGSGGMGDVYLADRADDEYQQRVAIKLVRSGAFSPQVQSRLRMERQILASLQHPNIARLLDGGRAPDGTPYLVMEYIEGEPIDVYCDRRKLPIAERLKLVRSICAAVHYAHQNLIVHRDLKPNNILITADGQPKLLDFGIAKLLDTRYTAQTLAVTHFEYRVMTPAHASPEQVRGDLVTTASDIYVLGVLMYELLCGRRPFQFTGTSLIDIERVICEQEAPPPSTMLARTAEEAPELLADIIACRSTTLPRLQRELREDLDNIIAMAMRKDPERRYSSAEQLGADIDRYLTGMPVSAAPDAWTYRVRKFVARHALGVSAAALAVIALSVFSAVTYLQAQRIAQERDVAQAERTRAEQVSSFLVELFELSDPSRSRGNQVTARELLDIGARRVNAGLAAQPETRALLLDTIGRVYNSLGLYPDSAQLLEDALDLRIRIHGERHPEVAKAMGELGQALCQRGDLQGCEQRLDAALTMQRELLGPESAGMAPLLAGRALLAQLRGALDSAEQLYDQALAIYRRNGAERSPEAASILMDLATIKTYRGDYERAVMLYRTGLDIDRQALGADHPHVGMGVHNLAVALQSQGDLDAAEPLYVESTRILAKVLGETHPQTLDAMSNYGRFLHRKGDLARAEDVLARVLDVNRRARGADHAFVGHDLVSLGLVQIDQGAYVEAEATLRGALEIYERALPADHPYIASALGALGRAQFELRRWSDAEETLQRALTIAEHSFGADSPQLAAIRSTQGRLRLAQGRPAEAASLLRPSYPVLLKTQGENAVLTRQTRAALAQLEPQR